MVDRFSVLFASILLLLFAVAGPTLAFEGAGGDVLGVCVSDVDQAVAAVPYVKADLIEATQAEAVVFVAVLQSTERGGVVLCDCTKPVVFSGNLKQYRGLRPKTYNRKDPGRVV